MSARTSTGTLTSNSIQRAGPSTSSSTALWETASGRSSRPGLRLLDVVEPEWPEGHDRIWGQWGPERGALMPGTAIYVTEKA